MQRIGFDLVDARGIDRVVLAMYRGPVVLRPVTGGDADRAWAWRNDPLTHRFFRNPAPVSLAEHHAWWNDAMRSRERRILMASRFGSDIGVLRFDFEDDIASVSIYLDPALHGLGLGTALIAAGDAWLRVHCPSVFKSVATVLESNAASKKAFAAAGYRQTSRVEVWEKLLAVI